MLAQATVVQMLLVWPAQLSLVLTVPLSLSHSRQLHLCKSSPRRGRGGWEDPSLAHGKLGKVHSVSRSPSEQAWSGDTGMSVLGITLITQVSTETGRMPQAARDHSRFSYERDPSIHNRKGKAKG